VLTSWALESRPTSVGFAAIHAYAFSRIGENAVEARCFWRRIVYHDPRLDPLRGDPEVRALFAKSPIFEFEPVPAKAEQ